MKQLLFKIGVTRNFMVLSVTAMLFVISCADNRTSKEEDKKEEPVSDTSAFDLTVQDIEDKYAMDFMNMLNVLREIRAGRGEELAASIEKSIPVYLEQLAEFSDSDLKTASFFSVHRMYEQAGKPLPEGFEADFEDAKVNAKKALSDECYDLLPVCSGVGCTAWPTSLRPVDTSSPNPAGWFYLKDSKCGIKWPKFWKSCGPPLNGPGCY